MLSAKCTFEINYLQCCSADTRQLFAPDLDCKCAPSAKNAPVFAQLNCNCAEGAKNALFFVHSMYFVGLIVIAQNVQKIDRVGAFFPVSPQLHSTIVLLLVGYLLNVHCTE